MNKLWAGGWGKVENTFCLQRYPAGLTIFLDYKGWILIIFAHYFILSLYREVL